jgi:hypothetical protein
MDEHIWAKKTVKKKGEGRVPVLEVAGASGAGAKKNRPHFQKKGGGRRLFGLVRAYLEW